MGHRLNAICKSIKYLEDNTEDKYLVFGDEFFDTLKTWYMKKKII